MKILFIGGTGNISAACVRAAQARGHEVVLLNRGSRNPADYDLRGLRILAADVGNEAAVQRVLGRETFDAVADFIAFQPADVERDVRLFNGRCAQYLFISSASAYQKPPRRPVVTESTPLENPYWEYARNKIACEAACRQAFCSQAFPVTIVRPSLTYGSVIPLPIGAWNDYTLIERMRRRQPVIVHGDGTALWTITHAEDFAKGFVGLIGNPSAIGEAFHITSDELLTWNQIYDAVGMAAGAGPVEKMHIPTDFILKLVPSLTGSLLGDKAHSVLFDNSKIKRAVPGFEATITFQEGMRRTIAWFEEKPERRRVHPATDRMIEEILTAYRNAFDAAEPL